MPDGQLCMVTSAGCKLECRLIIAALCFKVCGHTLMTTPDYRVLVHKKSGKECWPGR